MAGSKPSAGPLPAAGPLDWALVLRWRKRYAQYWRRRHGYRCPLDEYLSAGNLGIAEACARYEAARGDLLAYCRTLMSYRMQEVPRRMFGGWRWQHGQAPALVAKAPCWFAARRDPRLLPEEWTLARELLAQVQQQMGAEAAALLADWLMGWENRELGRRAGQAAPHIAARLTRIRRALRHFGEGEYG